MVFLCDLGALVFKMREAHFSPRLWLCARRSALLSALVRTACTRPLQV